MVTEPRRGTGAYTGQIWDGRRWVPDPSYVPPAAPVVEAGQPIQLPPGSTWDGERWVLPSTPTAGPSQGNSTGRTVGGIILVLVAGFALLQGISWFSGYADLEAQGNQFAGMLVPLALGAFAVAAGFGVWGILLLQKPRR